MRRIDPSAEDIAASPALQVALLACTEDHHDFRVFRTENAAYGPGYYVVEYEDGGPSRLWLIRDDRPRPTWGPIDWAHGPSRYYGLLGSRRIWLPREGLTHA